MDIDERLAVSASGGPALSSVSSRAAWLCSSTTDRASSLLWRTWRP